MGLIDGKKVLITGARKGIGRGIAITLANEGDDVGINDILDDEFVEKLMEIISNKGVKATFHKGDVSNIEGINSVFDSFMEKHGQRLQMVLQKIILLELFVKTQLKKVCFF